MSTARRYRHYQRKAANMEAVRAQPEHIWGNPDNCPGCIYSKMVIKRQDGPTNEDSDTRRTP